MRYFLRFEDLTTNIAQKLSIALLILATSLALYQVITRFAFGAPSAWSEVITRSAMIWSVFLGVAVAFKHGAMISVDVIQNALPPRLGIWVYIVASLGSFIFFAVLMWQGYLMTIRVIPQSLSVFDFSIAWVYAALPVGSCFILVAIIASIIRALQGDWLIARNVEEEL